MAKKKTSIPSKNSTTKTPSAMRPLRKKKEDDHGGNKRTSSRTNGATQVAAVKKTKKPSSATKERIEGKEAEVQLTRMLQQHATTKTSLIAGLRKSLRKLLPKSIEVIYEYSNFVVITYSPNGKGYDGILSIKANDKEVKLYFNRSRELDDPNHLLKGSGTLARFIKIDTLETIKKPELVALISQAIDKNTIPFHARAGASIVIQTSKEE